jgi:hypothetical protein
MNTKNIEIGLTKGLVAGYGGKTDLEKIKRAGFSFISSHLEENDLIYHDEWLASDVGGGKKF